MKKAIDKRIGRVYNNFCVTKFWRKPNIGRDEFG